MSLFMYATEIWACVSDGKYLSQIDKFIKLAVKYGYTNKRPSIAELIRTKNTKLWSKVLAERSTSPTETRALRREVTTIFYHKSDLNALGAVS